MQALHTTGTEYSSLPTPTVADQFTGSLSSTQQTDGSLHSVTLAQIVNRPDLLPTPIVRDYKDGQKEVMRNGEVQTDTVGRAVMNSGEIDSNSWGRFESSIRRWEAVTGRKAPAPTVYDGKDGRPRLSPLLTEWMMGVPKGWITDCGLSRNEELKACGNGVVPQQAVLALRYLLRKGDDE